MLSPSVLFRCHLIQASVDAAGGRAPWAPPMSANVDEVSRPMSTSDVNKPSLQAKTEASAPKTKTIAAITKPVDPSTAEDTGQGELRPVHLLAHVGRGYL